MNPARIARFRAAMLPLRPQLRTNLPQFTPIRPYATKFDPSKYVNEFGRFDAESIRQINRLEERVGEAFENIDEAAVDETMDTWWPNREDDEAALDTPDNNPFSERSVAEPKFYEPLNFDKPEDFAKAISYLSEDKGPHAFNSIPVVDEEDDTEEEMFPIREILKIGRHTQITAAGRVYSFSALILLGTGRATAGLGYGRGNTVPEAVVLAKRAAEKSMLSLKLHRGTSIGGDIKTRYKRSWVWMKACRFGHGTRANPQMKLFLDSFGLRDITVGRGGSRNRQTVYRALFKALRDGVRTPEGVSRMLGRKLFNRTKTYYYQHE